MRAFLLAICCLGSASLVWALDSIRLELGSSAGSGWQAKGVIVQWHWLTDNQVGLTLEIASLTLATLKTPLENLSLTCQRFEYNTEQISCSQANLLLGGDLLDKPHANLSFTYSIHSQQIQLNLDKLAFGGGYLSLQAQSAPSGWQAQLNLKGIEWKKFSARLNTLIDLPVPLIQSGNIDLTIAVSGNTEGMRSASVNGQVTNLHFSNTKRTQAGEQVLMTIAFQVKQNSPKVFEVQGTLTLNGGYILIDPISVEIIKEEPVSIAVNLLWQPQRIVVRDFTYDHAEVTTLQGTCEFTKEKKWKMNKLSLQSRKTPLQKFYTYYLTNWLETDLKIEFSQMNGMIKATLDWRKDDFYVMGQLYNVAIESQSKSFSLVGLNGKIQWHNNNATHFPSHLRWANIYATDKKISLDASQVGFLFNDSRLKLLVPWYQPLLGGAIFITEFELENLGKEDMSWQLSGQLEPISLIRLSRALEGPTLKGGQLAGEFPLIRYHDKQLETKGKLRMRVFDGEIVVSQLSLNKKHRFLSELKADIDINKFNLKTLTDTFTSLGGIQGQLSGYIHDLRLVNWQPVSFDAYFATPLDDPIPHKISQKAINNFSSLGGGGAVNAISRSVLRIFEDFYYQRIGWGCRLEKNGICKMHGVEVAPKDICKTPGVELVPEGYYIIKGGGLPRIDVIGCETSVDWRVLLSRLKRVTNISEIKTPIIE